MSKALILDTETMTGPEIYEVLINCLWTYLQNQSEAHLADVLCLQEQRAELRDALHKAARALETVRSGADENIDPLDWQEIQATLAKYL